MLYSPELTYLHVDKSNTRKVCLPRIIHQEPKLHIYKNISISNKTGEISESDFDNKLPSYFPGTIAIICCNFHDIYYHWLFDLLPKIKILEEANIEYDAIYLPKPSFPFQVDTLKLIGLEKPIIYASDNTKISAAKAIHIDKITNDTIPPHWVYEYIRGIGLRSSSKVTAQRKIYISRKFARNRRVLNEDKLVNLFLKNSIDVICSEKLSLDNQIKIFNQASLIISPHGSGLSNIVFANPQTKIIELKGPRCGETSFARLADWAKLDYISIAHKETLCEQGLQKFKSVLNLDKYCAWDFNVDPNQIIRSLNCIV